MTFRRGTTLGVAYNYADTARIEDIDPRSPFRANDRTKLGAEAIRVANAMKDSIQADLPLRDCPACGKTLGLMGGVQSCRCRRTALRAARSAGVAAGRKRRGSNPHQVGSDSWLSWQEGYTEGASDA